LTAADDGNDLNMDDDDYDPLAAAGPDGSSTAVRHRQPQQVQPSVQPSAQRQSHTTTLDAGSTASASQSDPSVTDTLSTLASGSTMSSAITSNDGNATTGRSNDGATDVGNTRHGGAGSKLKKMRYNRKQLMVRQ